MGSGANSGWLMLWAVWRAVVDRCYGQCGEQWLVDVIGSGTSSGWLMLWEVWRAVVGWCYGQWDEQWLVTVKNVMEVLGSKKGEKTLTRLSDDQLLKKHFSL
jgi:hypothetical protein